MGIERFAVIAQMVRLSWSGSGTLPDVITSGYLNLNVQILFPFIDIFNSISIDTMIDIKQKQKKRN